MILAILQARVSSSRLPGKVLKPILGEPMLARQIERLKHCHSFDRLVVATSSDASDAALVELCDAMGVDCFRGDLDDVLDRFYQAAKPFAPEHVVRLTGDCPLTDPALIDDLVRFHLDGGFDYSSNCLEPSYPDGLDAEVLRYTILEEAWKNAQLKSQREHVTLYVNRQPDRFRLGSMKNAIDLSAQRWTVDEAEDYEFVTRIYEELYVRNPMFGRQAVLDLLEKKPQLTAINRSFKRNEGLDRSLKKEQSAKSDVSKGE